MKWREVVAATLKRDANCCAVCSARSDAMICWIHHNEAFKHKTLIVFSAAITPMDNEVPTRFACMMILCVACRTQMQDDLGYLVRRFGGDKTPPIDALILAQGLEL